jgi:hypothetical protein
MDIARFNDLTQFFLDSQGRVSPSCLESRIDKPPPEAHVWRVSAEIDRNDSIYDTTKTGSSEGHCL